MSSNIKTAYAASVNHTITLASLATDTSLLAGRAGAAIDETSNLYLDEILAGFIETGTSPTVGTEIDVYVYGSIDDVPTYPDGITGSDANKTITNVNVLNSGLKLVASITVTASSNVKYPFGPISVAALFGGVLPKHWGVFIVHNTGVNLNSTGGNHQVTSTGLYSTAS